MDEALYKPHHSYGAFNYVDTDVETCREERVTGRAEGKMGGWGREEERQRQRKTETVSRAGRLLSDTKQWNCNVLKGHRSQ